MTKRLCGRFGSTTRIQILISFTPTFSLTLKKKLFKKLIIKISYKSKNGYVDHSGEMRPLIHELLSNTDKLKRFLFNPKSCIYTGNDNSNEQFDACYVAYAAENNGNVYVYDWENGKNIPARHPLYDPDHFEYYFKGN